MKNKTDSLIKENEEKFYRKAVLMAVIIGTFMAVLDSSIVNIATMDNYFIYPCNGVCNSFNRIFK